MTPRAAALALAAALLCVAAPAVAAADTFVAAPDATRAATPCTTATPCDLSFALLSPTAADDRVELLGGTYTVTGGGTVQQAYGTLEPAAGQHATITGDATIAFSGTLVRDLSLDTTGAGGGLTLAGAATGERLRVAHAEATNPAILVADSATLRDSVAVERAAGGVAVDAGGPGGSAVALDNVTAVATGAGGAGIDVTTVGEYALGCNGPGPTHATIRNVIARGPGTDLRVRMSNPRAGCPVPTADVDHTNLRTSSVADGGVLNLGEGNQTAPAQTDDAVVFADTSEYRQREGSPTIDAGLAAAGIGERDRDGDARIVGLRPDIGADEMIAAPQVTTGAAQLLGPASASLRGLATAADPLAGVRFDYGADDDYGQTASATVDPGGGEFFATAGMPAGTLLHYRAVATATNGVQSRSAAGADATILLPIAPGLPGPGPAPAPARKPLPKIAGASVIRLGTPARSCASRRTLTLRFTAPRNNKIVKATITLAGRTTTYAGRRLTPRIDLRGLPRGRFSVTVKVTLADGRTAALTKAYKTCVKKRR